MWSSKGTGGSFPVYAAISRAPATAGVANATPAQIRTIGSIRLEKLINEEKDASQIEDDCILYADASVRDALALIRRFNLSGAQNVVLSEDGILTIQWRKGRLGALMVFTGDGNVAISTAAPGKLYSQSPTQFPITDVPLGFLLVLKQLLA